ncbi:SLATT domain-containing protein [Vibrio parahaemolyticus]|nr:SLATT domain-containing protein [Vibrio parahaemolyticus]
MNKDELLKRIATTGYNVGFGAKKHLATYDIVSKTPGFIGFISMAFGIYALAIDALSTKLLSATFIILGIVSLYITMYDSNKAQYEKVGIKLTQYFNSLRDLYSRVKLDSCENTQQFEEELSTIESNFYECSISKQIQFSDWYAHYKFFWQHQIEWVNEQKKFTLLRDKLPLSFTATTVIVALTIGIYFYNSSIEKSSQTPQTNCATASPELPSKEAHNSIHNQNDVVEDGISN